MNSVISKPDHRHRAILSVSPTEEDHADLRRRLTRSVWCVYEAPSVAAARTLVSAHNIGIVFCERDLGSGSWREMLDVLHDLANAPPLIVASRLADDKLWAEALNLGAYDVLAKPFYQEELLRTVNLAWLRWFRQNAPAATNASLKLKAG